MLAAIWDILLELAPWMLLGTAIAGLLHAFRADRLIRRTLRGTAGVLRAVLVGIPLPLCSCGVIPAGLGLKRDGASDGSAIGFLISTPQTGVDSILVSASFLGWPFALYKVLAAGVTGIAGGLLTEWTGERTSGNAAAAASPEAAQSQLSSDLPVLNTMPQAETVTSSCCADEDGHCGLPADEPQAGHWRGWNAAISHAVEINRSIWGWLVIGILLSAAITTWLSDVLSLQMASWSTLEAGLASLVISLPLYVCATASVPIAATLVAGGLPTGAALVFLMAGPATNVTVLGTIYRGFGWRPLVIYLSTIIIGSLGFAVAFDLLLPQALATAPVLHHEHSAWWQQLSAVFLCGMLLWFAGEDVRRWFAVRRMKHRAESPRTDGSAAGDVELPVFGMTCGNCVQHVERTLRAVPGVEEVAVSLKDQQALVRGTANRTDLEQAVQAAGYQTENDAAAETPVTYSL